VRFSFHTRFSRFNGTASQPTLRMGTWHAPPRSRPNGRCPVQPNTPLGPDQVNVYLFVYLRVNRANPRRGMELKTSRLDSDQKGHPGVVLSCVPYEGLTWLVNPVLTVSSEVEQISGKGGRALPARVNQDPDRRAGKNVGVVIVAE
jgi:hypothetical protein